MYMQNCLVRKTKNAQLKSLARFYKQLQSHAQRERERDAHTHYTKNVHVNPV